MNQLSPAPPTPLGPADGVPVPLLVVSRAVGSAILRRTADPASAATMQLYIATAVPFVQMTEQVGEYDWFRPDRVPKNAPA